jgi:8-amino-7-oxononanoate synthase
VNPLDLHDLLTVALDDLRTADRYRQRRPVKVLDAVHVEVDGRRYINFASNNYLGLSHHPEILNAVRQATESAGWGSGAAPLITGCTEFHAEAEKAIAAWKGMENALLFPSGFQANQAAISGMAAVAASQGRPIRFFLDKLSHASLIDAVRATGQWWRTFPHNDIGRLRKLLAEQEPDGICVVITESIFSMDGDAAELRQIASLKRDIPFVFVLDEAHGSGVFGNNGSGLATELGVADTVDLAILTLSKALGGVGGAVCGSNQWCDAIVNFARPYIFSTSLPAAAAAAARAAISVMRTEPHRQNRVRELARNVRTRLAERGITIPAGDSPIIPVILGDERTAMEASGKLREKGILVPAIRPPSVPRGSSRLRITLSCEHSDEEVKSVVEALAEVLKGSK